jgi:hypothetical protein
LFTRVVHLESSPPFLFCMSIGLRMERVGRDLHQEPSCFAEPCRGRTLQCCGAASTRWQRSRRSPIVSAARRCDAPDGGVRFPPDGWVIDLGTVKIKATLEATDDQALFIVELRIDGRLVASSGASPLRCKAADVASSRSSGGVAGARPSPASARCFCVSRTYSAGTVTGTITWSTRTPSSNRLRVASPNTTSTT